MVLTGAIDVVVVVLENVVVDVDVVVDDVVVEASVVGGRAAAVATAAVPPEPGAASLDSPFESVHAGRISALINNAKPRRD